MTGYIKLSITDKKINSTLSVKSRRIFKLPDDVTLFYIEMYSGLNVIVTSRQSVDVEGGLKKQPICFFDHEVLSVYKGNLVVMLQVFELTASSYVFEVSTSTPSGKFMIGNLRANKSGVLKFNHKDIESVKSQRLLTKALMLEAK